MCEVVTAVAVALLGSVATAGPAPARQDAGVRVEEVPGGYKVTLPRAAAIRLRDALARVDEKAIGAAANQIVDRVAAVVSESKAVQVRTAQVRLAISFVCGNATAFKRSLGARMGTGGVTLTVRESALGRLGAGVAAVRNPLAGHAAGLRARVQAAPLPAEWKAWSRAGLLLLTTPVEALVSPSGWSLAPRN